MKSNKGDEEGVGGVVEYKIGYSGRIPAELEELYATKFDASEILHVTENHVVELLSSGKIEKSPLKYKRFVLISRKSIQKFLDSFLPENERG